MADVELMITMPTTCTAVLPSSRSRVDSTWTPAVAGTGLRAVLDDNYTAATGRTHDIGNAVVAAAKQGAPPRGEPR